MIDTFNVPTSTRKSRSELDEKEKAPYSFFLLSQKSVLHLYFYFFKECLGPVQGRIYWHTSNWEDGACVPRLGIFAPC